MPRAKEHRRINIIGGVVIGGLRNVKRQTERMKLDPSRSFDWGELLVSVALSGAATLATYRVPDMIEPADSWDHRGSFHSVTVLALSAGAALAVQETNLPPLIRDAISDAFTGNALHLAADARTKMGLQLI